MELNVHLYNSEAEAQAAIDAINEALDYPRQGANTYAEYKAYKGQYYIIANDLTKEILLEATTLLSFKN